MPHWPATPPKTRGPALPEESVHWLKTNFLDTEFSSSATACGFGATSSPGLAADAAIHGWTGEVERYRCTANRLAKLLTDLGEPFVDATEPVADGRRDLSTS